MVNEPQDNVYIYKWKGLITGWDYRLKIYGAGGSPLSNVNEIALPPGSISCRKLLRGFDKYPWGNQKTPTMELEIDLNMLNGFEDFKRLLYDPIVVLANPVVPAYTMRCGTVFLLEIKYNRNSDPAVNIYRPLFNGIHRQDVKIEFDFKIRHQATLTIEDAARVVLDSLNPFAVMYADDEQGYTHHREYQHELAWTKDGYTWVVGQKLDGYTIAYKRRYHFDNVLQSAVNAAHKQLLRDDSKGLDVSITYPLHYKQTYDGSGGLGAYVHDDDIYVPAAIYNTYENHGLWGLSSKLSLPNSFKNSLWDYYTELFEQNLSKAIIEPSIFNSVPIYGSIGTGADITLDVRRLKSLKIASLLNESAKSTASHYEFYSGAKYSDLNKYENAKVQGRNTGEITVPMVYHNMPTAYDNYMLHYNSIFDPNWQYGYARFNYVLGKFVKIRNLFYMDSPSILQDGADPQAFKVHDWVDYYINNNTKLSSKPGFGFTPFNMFNYYSSPQFKAAEVAMRLQSIGWSAIITKALDLMFGINNLARITIEIEFNEYTWFEPGGAVGFPHARLDTCYIFDLDQYYDNIDIPSDKWYMVSSELDFDSETAKIELISGGLT